MGKILQPPHMVTLVQMMLYLSLVNKNTIITIHDKRIPSVLPWVGELAILHIKLSYKVYYMIYDQKVRTDKYFKIC
jgi:hypothetical protein